MFKSCRHKCDVQCANVLVRFGWQRCGDTDTALRTTKIGSPSQIQSQKMVSIQVRPSLYLDTAQPCWYLLSLKWAGRGINPRTEMGLNFGGSWFMQWVILRVRSAKIRKGKWAFFRPHQMQLTKTSCTFEFLKCLTIPNLVVFGNTFKNNCLKTD